MITTSSPSYHNVFCPTAGTYSSYYFDALRANSRRSNKRVSLVRNTLSRSQIQQQGQQQQQQKSVIEKKQPSISSSNKTNGKKKSVRFSDKIDQVRLFYQWETPQQVDNINDNVLHPHHEQQQKHHLIPENTMVPRRRTTTVTTPVTNNSKNKNQQQRPQQQFYQLVIINNKKEQGVTILKKEHQLLSPQVPLKLKSVHVAHKSQEKNSSLAPTIVGTCHVANFAFEKHVMIRYTFDNWSTFTDIDAVYCESLADSTVDRFIFEFKWKNNDVDSYSLQFALRYSVNDMEFWDNNNGNNYCARLITQQQEKNEDDSENVKDQQEQKGKLDANSKMLTATPAWISSSSSTFHQQKSNLFNATSISPWITSPFWTRQFLPVNNNNVNNNNSISFSSSTLQQFQQPQPIP